MVINNVNIIESFKQAVDSPIISDHITAYYWGLPIYKHSLGGKESTLTIAEDYKNGALDFNMMWGSFRILLHNNISNESIFFCDNAGNCCFFYDKSSISTTFLDLARTKPVLEPNYQSIAQLLMFNCVYGFDTLAVGINRTNPNSFYSITANGFKENSKELKHFSELNTFDSMHSLMERLTNATKNEKVAAIITGGTDSRCVLAHLRSLDVPVELTISGEDEHIDVKIGREIAETLGLNIHVSSGIASHGDDWIKDAFIASDGMVGTFGRYRLLEHAKMLKQLGFTVEFGGVGGESFKNSFINQDAPFYRGNHPDFQKFYNLKISANDFPNNLIGNKIKPYIKNMQNWIHDLLYAQIIERDSKYHIYNQMGYFLLQNRVVSLSNYTNGLINTIQPLIERDGVAIAYNTNPHKLEMQRYMRNEISIFCPTLKNIPTDRGLTCNSDSMMKETLKNYIFLVQVGLRRVFMRKTVLSSSKQRSIVAEQKYLHNVIDICKNFNIDIFPDSISIDNIPYKYADRLATISAVFDRD